LSFLRSEIYLLLPSSSSSSLSLITMPSALGLAVTDDMSERGHVSTVKSSVPPILGAPEYIAKATNGGHESPSNGHNGLFNGHNGLSNGNNGFSNGREGFSSGHEGFANGHDHDLGCSSESSRQNGDGLEPIAVIGMALKFPQDATSPEAFWQMLMEGRSAMTNVPEERFNVDAFYKSASSKTRGVCYYT
jgi:Beta-ketoacyl synthase, N-terminal domain